MHIFLAVAKREVLAQLSRLPIRARLRRRLSCTQREKETLLDFEQSFLELKVQAPDVSDDQVIAQAIKAL
jgi:hypothetical protein